MPAEFPDAIYIPRTIANRPGVVYDPADTKTFYKEDFDGATAEIVAIENELGENPKGSYASVAAFLSALSASVSAILLAIRFIIDLCEYASNATAQAAFVSNNVPADVAPHNMTASNAPSPFVASSSPEYGPYPAWTAFDSNDGNYALLSSNAGYWKIDLGSGNAKTVLNYSIGVNRVPEPNRAPQAWTLQGSNNDSTWTTIDTVSGSAGWSSGELRNFVCDVKTTAYRYFKLVVTANNGDANFTQLRTLILNVGSMQTYSEPTIKSQGSYSVKAIANITDSLNKTVTKTFSPVKNLSGKSKIYFDVYASRTGSNLKFGFHDSGGTTTEITPNITQANTWQTVELDISAVSDANKDAIDSLIITVLNADADNTFYIDNIYA